MREALQSFDTEDVYELPLLAEAGEYADATQGLGNVAPEGPLSFIFY